MSGFTEQFKGRWIVNLFNLILRTAPTLWWADGHRVVPRGDGIEVMGHPSDGPEPVGAPTAHHEWQDCRAPARAEAKTSSASWCLGPEKGTSRESIDARDDVLGLTVTKVQSPGAPVSDWRLQKVRHQREETIFKC